MSLPLTSIVCVEEGDVVLDPTGEGVSLHPLLEHPKFRYLLKERQPEYESTPKLQQPLISLKMLEFWREQNGRFLKYDPQRHLWNDIGDKKAREQIGKALRFITKNKDWEVKSSSSRELGGLWRDTLAVLLYLEPPIRQDVLLCALQKAEPSSSAQDQIDLALRKGILVPLDEKEGKTVESATQCYRLASDDMRIRVKRLVLHTDSCVECRAIHKQIGRRLLRTGLDDAIAMHHLRAGMDQADRKKASAETCHQLASVSLVVGKECARSSDFHRAAENLDFGIQFLQQMKRHWRDHYDLSLAIFQASAEAHSAVSEYDLALARILVVKSNARHIHDTATVCATEISIYGMQGARDKGIDTGIEVLRGLGVRINPKPRTWHIVFADLKLRSMLRGKSCDMIRRMPDMTDENAIAAMQMLNVLFNMVFSSRGQLLPLVILHMVGLTVKKGVSAMSAVGFAMYGMILCASGKVESGEAYGYLALDLYKRFPVREWLPRIYAGLYGGIFACVKSPAVSVEHLTHAYEVGMETGDTEFALVDNFLHKFSGFAIGWLLESIESQLLGLFKEAIELKQVWIQHLSGGFLQFFQNLMGMSEDPTRLIGTFNADECDVSTLDPLSLLLWPWYRMILCCLFNEYKRAAHESTMCRGVEFYPNGNPSFVYASVFHALSVIGVYNETGRGRRRAMQEIRRQAKFAKTRALLVPSVCSCKLFLLDAELAWLQGKHDVVWFKYNSSMSCAKANKLLFDEALANERFARYKMERGDGMTASQHFSKAEELYRAWGAVAKAEHLADEVDKLPGVHRCEE